MRITVPAGSVAVIMSGSDASELHELLVMIYQSSLHNKRLVLGTGARAIIATAGFDISVAVNSVETGTCPAK